MVLHGADRQVQAVGDVGVAGPVGEELQHLELAGGDAASAQTLRHGGVLATLLELLTGGAGVDDHADGVDAVLRARRGGTMTVVDRRTEPPACRPAEELELAVLKPTSELHRPAGAWRPATDVAGRTELTLSEDPQTGDHTRLVRFDRGTDTTAAGVLRHDFWEEAFIVEDDLTDPTLGETFTAGMYACRPPGMAHGHNGSPTAH